MGRWRPGGVGCLRCTGGWMRIWMDSWIELSRTCCRRVRRRRELSVGTTRRRRCGDAVSRGGAGAGAERVDDRGVGTGAADRVVVQDSFARGEVVAGRGDRVCGGEDAADAVVGDERGVAGGSDRERGVEPAGVVLGAVARPGVERVWGT